MSQWRSGHEPSIMDCSKWRYGMVEIWRQTQMSNLKNSIFRDITPCNPLNVNWRFWETHRPHLQGRRISRIKNQLPPVFTLIYCSTYSSAFKMEAIYSSEASVDFQQTTRSYIPDDSTLHNQRSENFNSYKFLICVLANLSETKRIKTYSTRPHGTILQKNSTLHSLCHTNIEFKVKITFTDILILPIKI
jgi:hypothetical protein